MNFVCVVIPADPDQPCRLETVTSVEQMERLVGGYVEAVRVDAGRLADPSLPVGVRFDHQATLYVNEDAKAFLPHPVKNERASRFYPWNGGIIGDAFIAGPTVAGEELDVRPDVIVQLVPGLDELATLKDWWN